MLKRVAQFSAWQGVAQAISAATIFVLATMLPSGPLSAFGYALSVSSLVSNFASLRIEQAILVARSDDDAGSLALCAQIAAAAVCLSITGVVWLLHQSANALALVAGSMTALSMTAVTTSQQLLIRAGRSNEAGRIAMTRALAVGAVVTLAVLVYGRTERAALIGLTAASVGVTLLSVRELAKFWHAPASLRGFLAPLTLYRDVWTSYLGQSVLSGISLNAPYLTFFHAVNHQLVASYLLADRVARTPIALLSISVRTHLTHNYSDLAKGERHREAGLFMKAWSLRLALIGALGLVFLGCSIWLFGERTASMKWTYAGIAVLVLTPWAASTLSNSPAKAALTALRKNAYVFNVQAIELAARLAIIALVLPIAADHFFLALFCIHFPGILLNTALQLRAGRAWQTPIVNRLSQDAVQGL